MHINTDIVLNVIVGVFVYKSTLAIIKVTCEILLKTLEKVVKEVGK